MKLKDLIGSIESLDLNQLPWGDDLVHRYNALMDDESEFISLETTGKELAQSISILSLEKQEVLMNLSLKLRVPTEKAAVINRRAAKRSVPRAKQQTMVDLFKHFLTLWSKNPRGMLMLTFGGVAGVIALSMTWFKSGTVEESGKILDFFLKLFELIFATPTTPI